MCIGTESGQLVLERRMTTRPEEGPDKVLEIIMVLAREVMARSGLPDVGAVGSAAPAEGLKAG